MATSKGRDDSDVPQVPSGHGNAGKPVQVSSEKYHQVISLGRLSELLRNGDPLPDWSVVITVDDGHGSFYQYAYPVFAKFDFPVTMYLTTGPMDNRGWLWFDRVAYAFLTSDHRKELSFPTPLCVAVAPLLPFSQAAPQAALPGSTAQRLALAEQYVERMKTVSYKHFPICLDQLEQALEVQVPDEPPQEWAMLSWDQVRVDGRRRS